ncbi:hypothetical protein CHARACLAT_002383 [Characodon lateralis]|uniref:Uncharacterized protein n=1 Tax=Characodon lateralis TaxID=208331 RepID=A0ABU7DD17_9TELE|nr:hypothetical protein [Characodon lateralis]
MIASISGNYYPVGPAGIAIFFMREVLVSCSFSADNSYFEKPALEVHLRLPLRNTNILRRFFHSLQRA